ERPTRMGVMNGASVLLFLVVTACWFVWSPRAARIDPLPDGHAPYLRLPRPEGSTGIQDRTLPHVGRMPQDQRVAGPGGEDAGHQTMRGAPPAAPVRRPCEPVGRLDVLPHRVLVPGDRQGAPRVGPAVEVIEDQVVVLVVVLHDVCEGQRL